jgi:hypothetical protein
VSEPASDPAPAAGPDPGMTTALIAELSKKTAVSWLSVPGPQERSHAVWHKWYDDALCVVSGGDEQPLPDIEDGARVEVTQRSKDNGGRLVTWVGIASVVPPGTEDWDSVTPALVSDRLNLRDLSAAADHWARTSVVRRIVPTGELVEEPGRLSDDDHRDTPPPTPAATRGRLPRVLHRRVRRRPRLS